MKDEMVGKLSDWDQKASSFKQKLGTQPFQTNLVMHLHEFALTARTVN